MPEPTTARRKGGALSIALVVAYPLVAWAIVRQASAHVPGLALAALPVLINAGLLATFGLSLRGPQSLVERIARRQEPDLTPAKIRYCRSVTIVWCWFFVLNIAVIVALAVAAPLWLWAIYTGVVAYVLVGVVFVAEYVVRKAKFRDYGAGRLDRVLAGVFPQRDRDG